MTEAEQAEQAQRQAILELRRAIVSLETGELVDADNHIHHAQGWMRELR